MAGSGGSDLRAPIFNDDNYEFWKIRMRTIFKSHGIWDLVEKGLEIPESKGKKVDTEGSSESEKVSLLMKDTKALGIIQGVVSDDIFPRISNEETSKGAWDILLKYENYERIFVCGNFLCILLLVGGHIYNTTKPEWASK
ncbi:hypothetical protein L3X38_001803 [Prunus dulcis]|uniref:DUF4219 domain-containing protein n=1 Tax=Prunus dulcis TaxID=3755 RepID=A0AAD4WV43_PRUDU|nr:hypothetical protein L3X38_001803 [Prunus dulcis]